MHVSRRLLTTSHFLASRNIRITTAVIAAKTPSSTCLGRRASSSYSHFLARAIQSASRAARAPFHAEGALPRLSVQLRPLPAEGALPPLCVQLRPAPAEGVPPRLAEQFRRLRVAGASLVVSVRPRDPRLLALPAWTVNFWSSNSTGARATGRRRDAMAQRRHHAEEGKLLLVTEIGECV